MNSFKKHKINLVDTGCLQDSRYKAYFKKFVKPLKTTISLLLPLLVVFTLAQAGSLSPLSSPAATSYTLSDIYARLSTNASATAGSHSFGATTTPQSTFPTLTQIYSAIPTIYATDLLATSTYLGVTGTIAVKSGDADASVSATSTNKLLLTPATGYYNGSTATVSTTTTAFTPSSIKLGTYLFGIVGTLFGDTDASKVLTTASAAGTYNAANLSTATVKKGTSFGVSSTGVYSGYPGTAWSGTAITQATCDAQNPTWYWFEDGNGDGDTTDPEDGVCVRASAVTSSSWNGSEQIASFTPITAQAATAGAANSITKASAGWTANAYANAVVDITSGTASGCWGVVKSNTTDTITVYGSWLSSAYASSCGTPDATSVFSVEDDGFAIYDNSWIGDWSCTGSFPSGAPSWGSFPTSAQVGAGVIALATTDCYDGTRDLLPTEASRAVKTGTATAADSTTITDTALSLNTNAWVGQKALITGGTGSGGYGRIESNTATVITVDSWTGGTPDVGSTFAIVYLVPHASYNPTTDIDGDDDTQLNGNNGPLTPEVLNNWKGARLPTSSDFFGFCGYKDGGSNYESTTGTYTADKTYGNYGGQVGRTDEFLDLANSGSWEWLSEQHNQSYARVAGNSACSYFVNSNVNNGNRFRAVFRP
ncbi:MAG: Hemagglutinin family protein [Parcubacteria group bacterium]|nr:Hemagglutinin family protein [Parcubacteria group bacterium]